MAAEAALHARRAEARERAVSALSNVFRASGDEVQAAARLAWHAAQLLVRRRPPRASACEEARAQRAVVIRVGALTGAAPFPRPFSCRRRRRGAKLPCTC